jgi:cyclic pyranopterin phosphate synthase
MASRPGKPRTTLTHLGPSGDARMVDVGEKPITSRRARARAIVHVTPATARLLREGRVAKGDALAVARIAGIQAAKRTPDLLPLCHGVALTRATVELDVASDHVRIDAIAEARDRTGVEMEALAAASVAALALYAMLKAVDRAITFEVRLEEKEGGRSGPFARPQEPRSRAPRSRRSMD